MSSYTWEEIMLGIDVKAEQKKKADQERNIEAAYEKESRLGSAWSLGLSILGYALFGPAGGFIGKQLGKYGVDLAVDWETLRVDEGKFDVAETREYNKTIAEAASDQTQGQMVNTLLDLGTAYIQSGGLSAKPGEWDPTTFGSGEGEWSVFGRGDAGTLATTGTPYLDPTTGAELTPVIPGTATSADYVPSLWDRDASLFSNIGQTGEKLSTAYGQGQTIDYLYEQILGQQKQQERKQV